MLKRRVHMFDMHDQLRNSYEALSEILYGPARLTVGLSAKGCIGRAQAVCEQQPDQSSSLLHPLSNQRAGARIFWGPPTSSQPL